jgi:hypothetical protein
MAAGLGFKTFTTGEVLTAADTNGYLMQGVLVFASAAARDAAITSPQEGQCCYLKDTDAVLTYSGSAWVGFDDSNAIQNTIVDAKGDLIGATAADTPARLAVGTNGQVLTADSTAATGLKWATAAGGGKVLQVVYATTGTQTANSTSTYADTTLTATITPSSATSKVLVILSQAGCYSTVSGNGMQLRLVRGSTTVLTFAGALGTLGGSTERRDVATATTYLDSPATTSATTYKTQFASRTNSSTTQVQVTGADDTSTMTLLEIGA